MNKQEVEKMSARKKLLMNAMWQYLNQPLFTGYPQSIWQFSLYWYYYQVEFLEKCLLISSKSENQHH